MRKSNPVLMHLAVTHFKLSMSQISKSNSYTEYFKQKVKYLQF